MLSAKVNNKLNLRPLLNIDMAPVLNEGAEIVRSDIRQNYKDSKNVDGGSMTPLKLATIVQKRGSLAKSKKKGRFGQIGVERSVAPEKPLIRTGALAGNQLIQRATKLKQRAVIYISKSGANYRGKPADEIYGYHHEGAGNLPSRRPFGLSETARKRIAAAFHERIKRIVAGLGR